MEALLRVENVSMTFGGLKALSGLHFTLAPHELMGIIGPNGAGKSTFFNLVTGVYRPTLGKLFFAGKLLNPLRPHHISRLGIARTFQNIRLFPELTALDNVRVAFHHRISYTLGDVVLARKKYAEEEARLHAAALALLEELHLRQVAKEPAKNLSYGDQRRLEIARALATKPKLLLLDEPAAGMNASEKKELISILRRLHHEWELSILLIEHDMSVVMNLCPRILVLDYGVPIAEGDPEAIRKDPKVIEAYLGEPMRH